MNALFFWLFSIGMLVCGLSVILNRNPVACALSFAFSIFFMSGLFVMLDAFFLAAVQILVTAGAVMVLFLFIIMLLDITSMEHQPRRKVWLASSLVLSLGFIYLVAMTLNSMPSGKVSIDSLPASGLLSDDQMAEKAKDHPLASKGFLTDLNDDTHRIGKLLFASKTGRNETSYIAPFEVTSLLILIATIGVIVLCKQEDTPRRPVSPASLAGKVSYEGGKKASTVTR